MRVLWFANTSSNYAGTNSYNGGGWISSLESEISGKVTLGVAFLVREQDSASGSKVSWKMERRHGVCYFPVHNGFDASRGDRIRTLLKGDESQIHSLVEAYLEIIEDFQPDLIHVFGSEHSFGLVASCTDIPVVLHLQGLMNPYWEAFLPDGVSWQRYMTLPPSPVKMLHKLYIRRKWLSACKRENIILGSVRYFLGRTDWDRAQVLKANPAAKYFFGGEIMRPEFYEALPPAVENDSGLSIVTTISEAPYKGFDLVLRTGRLLRKKYRLEFKWVVYGNVEPLFFENITGISVRQAGITLGGVADAAGLVKALSEAVMYVHPSYIDNSPNGVCEAQLLGKAVVATRVGGIPSLIKDGETGFLVNGGRPEELAERIAAMHRNRDLVRKIGKKARAVALERHDRGKIVEALLQTYSAISSGI